jgi:hypothetical protein
MYKRASSMKYFIGDAVKFRLKLGEVQEGDVLFIEKSFQENILYINGYNRRVYRIPEKRIISKVPKKSNSHWISSYKLRR